VVARGQEGKEEREGGKVGNRIQNIEREVELAVRSYSAVM
jgi:hypothetical protein